MIRGGCEAYALFTVAPGVLHRYLTDFWKMMDTFAVLLTLAASITDARNAGDYRNGLNAIVVGLLWFKVLAFLKVVNKEMSTFIHALRQILLDIKYFAVVLVVVVFLYGDMFHVSKPYMRIAALSVNVGNLWRPPNCCLASLVWPLSTT